MSHGNDHRSSVAWTTFILLGIVAWLGITVYVAATNDDPSDATPILRTFAIAGAVFFGLVFLSAAIQMRRRTSTVNESLYRRLAVHKIPPDTLRVAIRRTQRIGPTYLLFAAATTVLMLTAIGLGEDGPTAALLYAGFALVLVWLVVMIVSLGRAFNASSDILAPLGLTITGVPTWLPRLYGGGGDLVGKLTFSGVRHGHDVSIAHRPGSAVTAVQGSFPSRTVSSPGSMAALTGEPAKYFRKVTATVSRDGIIVRRDGNGAGRYLYHDLHLAEQLAASVSTVES